MEFIKNLWYTCQSGWAFTLKLASALLLFGYVIGFLALAVDWPMPAIKSRLASWHEAPQAHSASAAERKRASRDAPAEPASSESKDAEAGWPSVIILCLLNLAIWSSNNAPAHSGAALWALALFLLLRQTPGHVRRARRWSLGRMSLWAGGYVITGYLSIASSDGNPLPLMACIVCLGAANMIAGCLLVLAGACAWVRRNAAPLVHMVEKGAALFKRFLEERSAEAAKPDPAAEGA